MNSLLAAADNPAAGPEGVCHTRLEVRPEVHHTLLEIRHEVHILLEHCHIRLEARRTRLEVLRTDLVRVDRSLQVHPERRTHPVEDAAACQGLEPCRLSRLWCRS